MLDRPTIVFAEDDRRVRESVQRGLRLEGYDVVAVADGQEAVDAVLRCEPSLVVLDVMMPVLDGLTACRQLRVRFPALPILMLTARHEVSDRIAGLDAGADDYLVKPFALGELSARAGAASTQQHLWFGATAACRRPDPGSRRSPCQPGGS